MDSIAATSDSGECDGARRRFAWLATAMFLVLTLPRLLRHELWRDEAWLWLVVQEAGSPSELLTSLGRTGQGYVFPLLCYLGRQVSTSPTTMQLLNLALAGAAAFVFLRWAPFPRRLRLLFGCGYFPFYEYAVLSRHYAAGCLLLWLACAAARSRRPLALGAALGLLCQTTVYGYILAIAVACGCWLDRHRGGPSWRRGRVAAGIGLAVAGAAAGLLQLIPAAGTSFAPGWHARWIPDLALRVMALPWRSFVPLPRLQPQFWNTNLLDPWPTLQAVAGVLVLALAGALLWRRRTALATFGVGTAGLLAFAYLKLVGEQRHLGHLWLLFAAALWLAGGLAGGRDGAGKAAGSGGSWRVRVLSLLLVIHCAAGAFASWMDLRLPFSNGAAVAELLVARGLDRHLLLGHREPPAATVALALGRPLYSPSRHLFTTHPDWGPQQREMSDQELRCEARALAWRRNADVVLVINRELPAWDELEPAGSRLGAIVSSEDYHLYLLRRTLLRPTEADPRCSPPP